MQETFSRSFHTHILVVTCCPELQSGAQQRHCGIGCKNTSALAIPVDSVRPSGWSQDSGAFRAIALMLKSRPEFSSTRGGPAAIELQLSVALYRLGHSISITEVAAIAGCSQGSVSGYTAKIVSALCDLESELIPWASEEEKREAKDWVSTRSGVPEFGQGFAMVDGVHIPLNWRPGGGADDDFINRKGSFSFNVQLFILPTSLRIISYVVGPRGRAADSSVFALSSVAESPALFLEPSEFIWADLGYPLNSFLAIPYRHSASEKSRDMRRFNYWQSHTRIRVEHAMGFIKGRFGCLRGLRGYVGKEEGELRAQDVVVACIATHNLAMSWDDAGQYKVYVEDGLGKQLDGEGWWEPSAERSAEQQAAWTRRSEAEEKRVAAYTRYAANRSQRELDDNRRKTGRELRETLHLALNKSVGYAFMDTTRESRLQEKTKKQYLADKLRKTKAEAERRMRAEAERRRRRQGTRS